MMFNVRGNVFVVWMRSRQCRVVRMRKVVVPIQPFFAPMNFIAISSNQSSVEIQFFSEAQAEALLKENLAFRYTGVSAFRPHGDRRARNGWAIQRFSDKAAVMAQQAEWIHRHC